MLLLLPASSELDDLEVTWLPGGTATAADVPVLGDDAEGEDAVPGEHVDNGVLTD